LGLFNDLSGNVVLIINLAAVGNLVMSVNKLRLSTERLLKSKFDSRQMESSLIWFNMIDEKISIFGSLKLSNRFLFLIIIVILDNTIVLAQYELDSPIVNNFNVFEDM
jgi:hypothetical protein